VSGMRVRSIIVVSRLLAEWDVLPPPIKEKKKLVDNIWFDILFDCIVGKEHCSNDNLKTTECIEEIGVEIYGLSRVRSLVKIRDKNTIKPVIMIVSSRCLSCLGVRDFSQ
jgi:hypothetical protein